MRCWDNPWGNDCGLPTIPSGAWHTVSLGQGFWCGIKMNGGMQCGVSSGSCYYFKGEFGGRRGLLCAL